MQYLISILLSFILVTTQAQVPSFMNKGPEEGLMEALEYYDIHHREIVYAQAILETGHFKSRGCTVRNNLFGLKGRKGYYRYKHWVESVIAYKEKIQSRYKDGEDYYRFLKRIHYASDPNYNNALKKIVKKNEQRNNSFNGWL